MSRQERGREVPVKYNKFYEQPPATSHQPGSQARNRRKAEWSFILLESRRWECSQSQKSIIYTIVKKLGGAVINMNIHLRFETSNIRFRNFLYSTGRLADLTWKYLDQSEMIDVDQRQCETMTQLMRRRVSQPGQHGVTASWPPQPDWLPPL